MEPSSSSIKDLARRVRALPLAVSLPAGFVALVAVLAIGAGIRRAVTSLPQKPVAVVTAPAAAAPVQQPKPAQPAADPGSQPAAPAQSPVPPPPPTVTAIAPPAGIASGWVRVTVLNKDQFGQYAQRSQSVAHAQTTSFESQNPAGGGPDWKQLWDGWFYLSAPAHVADLRVSGFGSAAASVDGQSLGQPLEGGAGQTRTAAVALGEGWHQFHVEVNRGGWMSTPAGVAVEVALGDGVNPPAPVATFAVPLPRNDASPASAASVDVKAAASPATAALAPAAPEVPEVAGGEK